MSAALGGSISAQPAAVPAVGVGARPAGRIAPLDGLRAIAVIGVLYAHVWSFVLGAPPLLVAGRFDANRALSVFGTGVDLFFVISGFCMYLMYGSRQQALDWRAFRDFVINRFRRIAPAYYASIIVSAAFVTWRVHAIPLAEIVAHAAFVSTFLRDPKLAASFWSLATEWHFYLLLPALVHFAHRVGFRRALAVAMVSCIAFRIVVAFTASESIAGYVDHLIVSRFVEFGWGMIAARLYLSGVRAPRILRGGVGFVFGWVVSLFGRAMMTDGATRMPRLGPWLTAASVVVLTFGYMLVVWNVVSEKSIFAAALATPPMRWLGRISYSLYLWHWDVGLALAAWLAFAFGKHASSPILYTAAVLVMLLPIAEASYRWLEAPYFKRRHGTAR